jgi:hypothetical protein
MYKHHLYLIMYLLLVAAPLHTIHSSLPRIGNAVETPFSICVGEIVFFFPNFHSLQDGFGRKTMSDEVADTVRIDRRAVHRVRVEAESRREDLASGEVVD